MPLMKWIAPIVALAVGGWLGIKVWSAYRHSKSAVDRLKARMTNRWDAIIGARCGRVVGCRYGCERGRRVLLLEKNTKAGPKS